MRSRDRYGTPRHTSSQIEMPDPIRKTDHEADHNVRVCEHGGQADDEDGDTGQVSHPSRGTGCSHPRHPSEPVPVPRAAVLGHVLRRLQVLDRAW
jgi:hypothetical protein